jgi:hypothetical protein
VNPAGFKKPFLFQTRNETATEVRDIENAIDMSGTPAQYAAANKWFVDGVRRDVRFTKAADAPWKQANANNPAIESYTAFRYIGTPLITRIYPAAPLPAAYNPVVRPWCK